MGLAVMLILFIAHNDPAAYSLPHFTLRTTERERGILYKVS